MQTQSGLGESLPERVSRCIAEGESYGVEFKGESRAPLDDRDLVEAVVCPANGSGGMLLVGVEDDGTVTGARPRHEADRTDPLRLQALIANSTQPPLSVGAATVQLSGQEVLVVEVPDSPRVVWLRGARTCGERWQATAVLYACHVTFTRCSLMR